MTIFRFPMLFLLVLLIVNRIVTAMSTSDDVIKPDADAVFVDDGDDVSQLSEFDVDNPAIPNRLSIDGIDQMPPLIRDDLRDILREFPLMIETKNMMIADRLFTNEASIVCSGLDITPRRMIKFYLSRKSLLKHFAFQSIAVTINRDGSYKLVGRYIWNKIALRQFVFYLLNDEQGHQKIDLAIIIGC